MYTISKQLAEKLHMHDIIKCKDVDLYAYLIQTKLEKVVFLVFISVVSVVLHVFWEVMAFYFFYSMQRKYSGGFHCKSYVTCLFVSTLTTFLSIVYAKTVPAFICQGGVIISMIFVFIIGAVNNDYIDWTADEFQKTKTRSRIVLLAELVILIVAEKGNIPVSFLFYMSYGHQLCAVALLIDILKKGGNKDE